MRQDLLALLVVSLRRRSHSASELAIQVHVRIEGATTTIYGAEQPRVTPYTGDARGGRDVPLTLEAPTALGALESASRRGEVFYRSSATSFGPYVAPDRSARRR